MVEYMNGGSLQNIVDGGGCRDHATLASIAAQSVQGLRYLHRSKHLHRDVKPANSKSRGQYTYLYFFHI
jgi:serine/threonine protein kinase